jgi:hypothetical protein
MNGDNFADRQAGISAMSPEQFDPLAIVAYVPECLVLEI